MATKKSYQTADAAQKGPGVGSPPTSRRGNDAPSIGEAGNAKSGTSQGHRRGKQGQ